MERTKFRDLLKFTAIIYLFCAMTCVLTASVMAQSAQEEAEKRLRESTGEAAPAPIVPVAPDASVAPVAPAATTEAIAPTDKKDELNLEQPAQKIDLPGVIQPEEVYQLKRIDPNRIGTEISYETFSGVRIPEKILKSPSIAVGQRVEIYQEPKPIDAYMIMAKEMQHTFSNYNGWWLPKDMTDANYRSIVVPLFVRAYGTEFTISDPNASRSDTQGQIRYTLDYRDVYREYYPKFPDLKVSNWLQHNIEIISMDKIDPIGWMYTSNIGYRFSNIDYKSLEPRWNFHSAPEWRSTYYINQALAPNERCELFAQGEYFKSNHFDSDWAYKPDHYLIAGELRLKSKDMKTSYTGRLSYSIDIYSPFSNTYEKYEIWARVGHDFNDRLNGYTMLKYLYGHTRSEDNPMFLAPPGYTLGVPLPFPFDVTAKAINWESRLQYRVYDKLWLQGGFDYSVGIDMSDFDNAGLLAGLEYYAPGMIRVDFGWRGNYFYNINDFLSTIYFKVYFFM
jgi:hypothetical protein